MLSMSPVLEGTLHRPVYSVISCYKTSSGLGLNRPCPWGLWGILELLLVLGSTRAGEAAWLMLRTELLFRALLHL